MQVLVHVSTYHGNPFWYQVFEPQPFGSAAPSFCSQVGGPATPTLPPPGANPLPGFRIHRAPLRSCRLPHLSPLSEAWPEPRAMPLNNQFT